jgi:heptose-I-phosphate ethanolaminephosphotransferase
MSQLGRLAGMAFSPVRCNASFFFFMYTVGIVCTWIEIPDNNGFHYYSLSYIELFLDLYVTCLVLTALPRKVRRWVRGALYIIYYATAIADVFCFVKFDSELTPTMLLLMGETTGREAGEFLGSYVSADVLFSGVGIILLIMLVHITAAAYPHMKRRLPAACGKALAPVRAHLPAAYPYLGAITAGLLIYGGVATAHNKELTWRMLSYGNIGQVEHELTEKDKANFYIPVYRLWFSMFANRLASHQIDQLVAAKDRVRVDSCTFRSPNIVLIIGESYNRHHAQLYGYGKRTTPRQERRAQRDRLVAFGDVVAPWNLTSYVFKNVFSMHVVGEKGEWCDYPLFPEIFRKAGYHVTFLTNQFLPQATEEVYDFSGGFFLNNPELSAAQFDTRNTSLHQYDDGLLDDYQALRGKNGKNNLIIFHLMGQHVGYGSRYPASRRHFKPGDYDRPDLTNRQRNILADYDNATLYNDSIVNEIIRRFENTDAIVIYMPDHGEECFDGGVKFYGRMHSTEITARLAREEFDIPFWIWCSHKYAVNHPEVYSEIVAAKNRRLMTDALPHTLLYLAGIYSKDYIPKYNVLSTEYDERRPRILKATTDYDKLGVKK